MSGVSGATSKPHSSPSPSSGPSQSKDKGPSQGSQSTQGSQSQSSRNKDTFESGGGKDNKPKVNLSGGGSVGADASTGPGYEHKDHADVAPGTTADHQLKLNEGQVGAHASGSADQNGARGDVNVNGSWKALQDHAEVNSKAKLVDGDKPLISDNTLSSDVNVGMEGHFNAHGEANKDGTFDGGFNLNGSMGVDAKGQGTSELNTVGDDGQKENLASVTVEGHGHLGLAGGIHGGLSNKDGNITTDFGMDLAPGAGGGFSVRFSVNPGNIAKEGAKIAEEIGQGAGDAGYQAQKQIGETLSGIQKLLGGVHLFG
ncbi:MAG TPA: hypothetical protein VND93_10530 [Myxococcales bacterium]|nr:hypothetical protein [Myxococcales bacterium]